MATSRIRETWTNVRADIRRLLGDTSANPYWDNTLLLQLVNDCLDRREAELDDVFEGYGVVRATVSLVAGQNYYKLPANANRVRNVTKLLSTGEEVPLHRTEKLTSMVPKNTRTGNRYRPDVRMVRDYIYLTPAPIAAETDTLIIYYEQARDKLTADGDQVIPDAWPHLTETLIKYDVAVMCFDVEAATDAAAMQGPPTGLLAARDQMERTWRTQIESRLWGQPTFSQPFTMWD